LIQGAIPQNTNSQKKCWASDKLGKKSAQDTRTLGDDKPRETVGGKGDRQSQTGATQGREP